VSCSLGFHCVVAAALWCLSLTTGARAAAQTPTARADQRALLVVQFGDGSTVTHCVAFTEESLSGLELLTLSGLEVARWGGAVCRIEQEGCDYPGKPCWCQCMGDPCRYWSYWQWRDGRWAFSQVGAASQRVRGGDVQAWLWGDGKSPPTLPPPAELCAGADAVVVRPSQEPTASDGPAASRPSAPSARLRPPPLGQYALFTAMAAVLLGAFWSVRRRHRG
jgi:hypothetical protein